MTLASSAAAQDYPTRPIRLLQGFAPGGNADAISRVLADELSKGLGQTVTVEARPGAGGNLASAEVAKASADGYTLVLLTTGHVISAALYKSLSFDPVNDFQFLTTVSELPFFVVVNASKSPYKTMPELVAAAQAKPGGITYGTAGVGTGQHLSTALLNSVIGSTMVHVPYRGDSGAVTGLLSGDIDFITAPLPAIVGNIQAGTFRALGATSAKPWPVMPDIPTIASVVPDLRSDGVDRRRDHARRAEADRREAEQGAAPHPRLAEVEKKLREFGGEPASSTPDEITTKVKTQIARWSKVIDEASIPRQ